MRMSIRVVMNMPPLRRLCAVALFAALSQITSIAVAEITFADPVIITEELRAATGAQVGDLDGDGDLDVAIVPTFQLEFAWLENTGDPFTRFRVHHVPLPSGVGAAWGVEVADVDGDGDLDILTSHRLQGDATLWHENLGGDPLLWESHIIHTFEPNPDDRWGSRSVAAADFDGDGDMDVVTSNDGYDTVLWHENLTADGNQWMTHGMGYIGGAWGVSAVDIDQDGDADILLAALGTRMVYWYENFGGTFVRHDVAQTVRLTRSANAADMDGDGDLDVISASNYVNEGIEWHRNEGGAPLRWTSFPVPSSGDDRIAVWPVDLDRDGDADILTNSGLGRFAWFESDGGSPPVFTEHRQPASESGVPLLWAVPGDFNGDGNIDVIATLHRYDPPVNRVVLFENISGDAYEWDDWVTGASPIAPGDVQDHSIHRLGDQDWTVFSLSEPAMISGAISGASSEILLYLLTYHEGWQLLDIEGGRNPALEAHLMPDVYYLVAEEWGNDALVPYYQLSLSTAPHAGDPYEVDNWEHSATPITFGVWSEGHAIHPVTDQDWFVFTLTERTEVNIRASSDGPDLALFLLYRAPMGWELLGLDGDDNPKLRADLPPGTYHVVVEDLHRDGLVTDYEVRVSD
jgi:FG-GAP-like repeat